jgi:hypothetical protein
MVTFLRNHPNFQNLFVWTNTNMISALYLTLNSQKSLWICAIMHSWKKRETHPKILGAVVSCLTVMLNVLFAWNNNKNERHVMNTEKHMILSIRKAHLTRKVLWSCEPNYQQKLEQVETKIKKFCRHDQIKVVFFFFRTRIDSTMHRWCNSPSVSFPTKAFMEMLYCVGALDRVCPQFLQAESLLGFEQRW